MAAGRNQPCPCGSGRRYKRCCGAEAQRSRHLRLISGEAEPRGPSPPAPASPPSTSPWEVDLVGGYQAVPLRAMTEYDLRIFLHDWCIRKVSAPKSFMRSIPLSLMRFLGFVAREQRLEFPWAMPILRNRGRFEERLDTAPGGPFWDPAVRAWQAEVTADLAARELLPDAGMTDGERWGDTMGEIEYRLHRELQRRWLLWRDDALAGG